MPLYFHLCILHAWRVSPYILQDNLIMLLSISCFYSDNSLVTIFLYLSTIFPRLCGIVSFLRLYAVQWNPGPGQGFQGTLAIQIPIVLTNDFCIYLKSNRIQLLLPMIIIQQKSEICSRFGLWGRCCHLLGATPSTQWVHKCTGEKGLCRDQNTPSNFPILFSTINRTEGQTRDLSNM